MQKSPLSYILKGQYLLRAKEGGFMNHKFSKNNKYYTIALYAIGVIVICSIIIKLIMNWGTTSAAISGAMDVLSPFIMALLIAYLLNPLVKSIDNGFSHFLSEKQKGLRKALSILLSYIIVLGLIVMAFFYIIPQILESLTQLTSIFNSAQSGYNDLMNYLLELENKHPELNLDAFNETLKQIPEQAISFITDAIPMIIPTIYNTSMSLISGVLNALIAIIVSIYMLIDKSRLLNGSKRILYAVFGAKHGDKFMVTASRCNHIFSGFIIGKLIDSLIIGILCFIIMSIFKLPYTLIISVIVGVTNMIPYFGPFIGAVPGILLLLFVNLKSALIFTVLIIILQQFDGLYLGPKILGDSTGLRPIWIIFAITVGGSIAGVLGMFLGVPTLAVIAYLMDSFVEKKLNLYGIFFCTGDDGLITRVTQNEATQEKPQPQETATEDLSNQKTD